MAPAPRHRRFVLAALIAGTALVVGINVWVAVTPGNNRWLGSDPMLGEFGIAVLPFVTAGAAVVYWRRSR